MFGHVPKVSSEAEIIQSVLVPMESLWCSQLYRFEVVTLADLGNMATFALIDLVQTQFSSYKAPQNNVQDSRCLFSQTA